MTGSYDGILANWRRQLAAMDAADTGSLRSCFTEDAFLVHMTGYRQPLAEWLAGISAGEFVYHEVIEKRVSVEPAGAGARLVGDIITGYRPDGSGHAWPLHVVQEFTQADGTWLCSGSRVTLG